MLNLNDKNHQLFVAASVFFTVLLYGYSLFVSLICVIAIGICTFFLTLNFLNDSKSRSWLINTLLNQLQLNASTEIISKPSINAKKLTPFSQELPWSNVNLPKSLNVALENFANCLIDDYVNQWYKSEVSADNTFLLEIKYQIRYGSAKAVKALRGYDFANLIQTELLPLVILHVNRVSKLLDSIDEDIVNVEDLLSNAFSNDLHIAMNSHENCEHYLSEIADHLVVCLLDDSRIGGRELDGEAPTTFKTKKWPSDVAKNFLRQLVLSTILMPILDFITNPDTLNLLTITALDPQKSELEDISKDERVPFLENLSKYSNADVPDSLLVLKLTNLIQDPRLLQIFDGYLKDIRGPNHYLDCFIETNDVLRHLQAIKNEESMEFKEVFSDAWQLYSEFIHKSAKTHIELFSEQLLEAFGHAIESKSQIALLKAVEEVYMILYHEINYNYVQQFCQSESYLGYLCGTSSGAEELFQADEQEKSAESESGQSTGLSSITQIPSKIWNVLRGDFGDENEEQAKSVKDEETQIKVIEEMEDQIDDEFKQIEDVDSSFLVVDDFTFDQSINMNQWKVSIPVIERRRRFRNGRIYFVYVVTIERNDDKFEQSTSQCCSLTSIQDKKRPNQQTKKSDLDESDEEEDEMEQQIDEYEAMSKLPKAWSIARTYDEFYVFDRRLRQHFGSNSQPFALLPDRKMLCPRTQKFLESQRQHMEAFLEKLTSQSNLKHSELFFAFLTNPGESGFENSLISTADLNAENAANQRRKREVESDDGEYLKPFISRLLAKALANDETYTMGVVEEQNKFETNSLDSGTYSLMPDTGSENGNDHFMLSKVSSTNPHLIQQNAETIEEENRKQIEALKAFQQLSENITSLAAYMFNLILIPHEYLKVFMLTIVDLFSNTFNKLFGRTLKTTMDTVLDETTILFIVKALHEVVFDANREEMSQEEIKQRAINAERLLKEWLVPPILQKMSKTAATRTQLTVHRIFQCFQNTTLNRQLAFVLVDKLAEHILTDEAEQILSRLEMQT